MICRASASRRIAARWAGVAVVCAAVAGAAGLSACAVGPNYHRPSAPVPSAWTTSYYAFHEFVGCAYYALR